MRAVLLAGSCCLMLVPTSAEPETGKLAGFHPARHFRAPLAIVQAQEGFIPLVTVELPQPEPVAQPQIQVRGPDPRESPVELTAIVTPAIPVLDIPVPDRFAPPVTSLAAPSVASDGAAAAMSPAQIVQLSEPEADLPATAQLHAPGEGHPVTLNDRIAAMQVTLPPPARLSRTEQAAFLADSPDRLQVRRGPEALGSVAFQVAPTRAIAVRLGDVLDLVAANVSPSELARLKDSAAAETFVPLETLRAAGITLQYDPVYDEFRLAG